MNRKPNLLFIFTDQQRADTLGCYGNRLVQTPNLDRLAGESVLFENAYVTQPVCTPARSSIMTGLYPHANGCTHNNVPLRTETPTIAEMVSIAVGKGDDADAREGAELADVGPSPAADLHEGAHADGAHPNRIVRTENLHSRKRDRRRGCDPAPEELSSSHSSGSRS